MIGRLATAILVMTLWAGQLNAEAPCTSYSGSLTIMLDQSEPAMAKATSNDNLPRTDRLDIQRDQLIAFLSRLDQEPNSRDVTIRMLCYTGFGEPGRLEATAPLDQYSNGQTNVEGTVAEVLNRLRAHGPGNYIIPDAILTQNGQSTGGSWTNTGMKFANATLIPRSGRRNSIVVVSAQGSFNTLRTTETKQNADALRAKGFKIYVIGVKNSPRNETGVLDRRELTAAANSSDISRYIEIDTYYQLAETLRVHIMQSLDFLCISETTTPAPTTTTSTTTTTTTTRAPAGEHPCDCAMRSGTYNIADNTTCQRFFICDKRGDTYYLISFDCGPGTLFSVDTHTCVEPKDKNCDAWDGKCEKGKNGRYADLCCRRYWECADGEMRLVTCPPDTIFDNGQKICRAVGTAGNPCVNDIYCSNGTRRCDNTPDPNNRCNFMTGNTVRQCQPGSAFNQDTCVCSDPAPSSCQVNRVPGAGEVDPSRDGADCKAVVNIPMTKIGSRMAVYNDYTNQLLNMYVDTESTLIADGVATFYGRAKTDRTGKSDNIAVYQYAMRSFPASWAMMVSPKFSPQADRLEYVLLTNDNCLQCQATFRLTASRMSATSNTWTFKFWAQLMKMSGLTQVNQEQAEITATIDIPNTNQFTSVVVKVQREKTQGDSYKAVMSGTVTTPNPSQPNTNIIRQFSTVIINNRLSYNECPLSIGQGRDGPVGSTKTVAFNGQIDEFKFYECEDLSKLV